MSTVIVDGNYQVNRAVFKNPGLTNSRGEPTGGVYLMLRMLWDLQSRVSGGKLVCVFDGGHSQRRKDIYPDYKVRPPKEATAERLAIEETFRYTYPELKMLLPRMAIPTIVLGGEEADDVIYVLAQQLAGAGEDVTVVSDDADYLQMVNIGVKILRPMKGEMVTKEGFKEMFGFDSEYFVFYKSILGDPSDNIDGVNGVGEKGAIQIIQKMKEPSLEDLYRVLTEGKPTARDKKVIDQFAVLKRNLQLIDLRFVDHLGTAVREAYTMAKYDAWPDRDYVVSYFRDKEFKSLNHWIAYFSK